MARRDIERKWLIDPLLRAFIANFSTFSPVSEPVIFPGCLCRVALIAASAIVRELEREISPGFHGDLVIGMKVPLTSSKCCSQIIQHFLSRGDAHHRFPEHPDNYGLPAAIDTSPLITFETEHTEPAVLGAITSVNCARARPWQARMLGAPAVDKRDITAAARIRTWALRERWQR